MTARDGDESAESVTEKAQLRKELLSTRSLLNQLLHETSHEKFDERRVYMLKAQVIQLERQMLLLSEAASSRADALIEVDNVAHHIRSTLSSACSNNPRSSDVAIPRNDLVKIMQLCDTMQTKIAKTARQSSKDIMWARPLTRSKFSASPRTPLSSQPLISASPLNICSGKLDYISLSAVSSLESLLCGLYKQLRGLQEALKTRPCCCGGAAPTDARLHPLIEACVSSLAATCADLMELSLLVPSAPWGVRRNPLLQELTADVAGAAIAGLAKSKSADVRAFLHAVTKATNHKCVLASMEVRSLEDELGYHKRVYEVQAKYVRDLLEGLQNAYTAFASDLHTSLSIPLTEILRALSALKADTTEENLRSFFTAIKQNADKLEGVVQNFRADVCADAKEAFLGYNDAFARALHSCKAAAESSRDRQLSAIIKAATLEGDAAEAELTTVLQAVRLRQDFAASSPGGEGQVILKPESLRSGAIGGRRGGRPARHRDSTGRPRGDATTAAMVATPEAAPKCKSTGENPAGLDASATGASTA